MKVAPVRAVQLGDGTSATMRADFGLGELGALRFCEYLEQRGCRLVSAEVREGSAPDEGTIGD